MSFLSVCGSVVQSSGATSGLLSWFPLIDSALFQLLDQLVHKEKELQGKEVEEELREEQRQVQSWERAAG